MDVKEERITHPLSTGVTTFGIVTPTLNADRYLEDAAAHRILSVARNQSSVWLSVGTARKKNPNAKPFLSRERRVSARQGLRPRL